MSFRWFHHGYGSDFDPGDLRLLVVSIYLIYFCISVLTMPIYQLCINYISVIFNVIWIVYKYVISYIASQNFRMGGIWGIMTYDFP